MPGLLEYQSVCRGLAGRQYRQLMTAWSALHVCFSGTATCSLQYRYQATPEPNMHARCTDTAYFGVVEIGLSSQLSLVTGVVFWTPMIHMWMPMISHSWPGLSSPSVIVKSPFSSPEGSNHMVHDFLLVFTQDGVYMQM